MDGFLIAEQLMGMQHLLSCCLVLDVLNATALNVG